jgi:hypothetical protein
MKRTWIRTLGASAAVLIAVLISSCSFTNYVDEGSITSPASLTVGSSHAGTVLASSSSYYVVPVSAFTGYTVTLSSKEYNSSVEVYSDAAFTSLIGAGPAASTTADVLPVAATGTSLYIKVTSSGSDLTFTLAVGANLAATAGGTSGAPVSIGSKPVVNFVAEAVAANGYYSVQVTPSVSTTITMNGLSADLDLYVYSDLFSAVIGYSSNGGTTADSVTFTPSGSTVYIKLLPFSGATSACLLTVN